MSKETKLLAKIDNQFLAGGHIKVRLLKQDGKIADYKGYKDVLTPRTFQMWEIHETHVANKMEINFPICTGGECIVTTFQILTEETKVMYQGDINSRIYVEEGLICCFEIGAISLDIGYDE